MKKLLLLAAITISTTAFAQENETKSALAGVFFEGTWEEAKQKAVEEGKYLFVDTYTDWCYWCKVMDKNTFTDKRVKELFKTKFVAYKMDMEKGYGITLAKKYRVSAYPSFLIFNQEGVYINKLVGYLKADEFITELKSAVNKENIIQEYIGRTTPEELDYPEFYHNSYLSRKERPEMPSTEEIQAYIDSREDPFDEVSWGVMYRFGLTEAGNEFFLTNIERYKKLYGSIEVNNKVGNIIGSYVREAAKNNDEALLDKAVNIQSKYQEGANDYSPYFLKLQYYNMAKDWGGYFETAEALEKKGQLSKGQINSISWTLYEKSEAIEHIKAAMVWMESVCETKDNYAFMDTYAALAYKAGEYDTALELAKEAIEIGEENDEDVDGTKELVKQIKTAMKEG